MRTLVVLASFVPAAAFAGANPEIRPYGDCPGTLQVAVVNVFPSGDFVIVSGRQEGSTPIPSGPCAGFPIPLQGNLKVRFEGTADINGNGGFSIPSAPAAMCDRLLVAVDLTTCQAGPIGTLTPAG